MKQQTLWDQEKDKFVPIPSGKVCGTCEFIQVPQCIITSRNRRKVDAGTPACDDHSEDLSNRPLVDYPLSRLGFRTNYEADGKLRKILEAL